MTRGPLRSSAVDGCNGAFDLRSPVEGWRLALIASDGSEFPDRPDYQWQHVSVRAYRWIFGTVRTEESRTPTWDEMVYAKRCFWDDEDVVMELHPARSEYVNVHPNVLHLWRPKRATIPTPPKELVG